MQPEIWRPIVGYEGIYSVSDRGGIRRDAGGRGTQAGRIVAPKRTQAGYRYASLSVADRKRRFLVHQLVARAFLGAPPSDQRVVNHKDGNKINNVVGNLEWCTIQENNQHAAEHDLLRPLRREENPRAKLTEEQVAEIRAEQGKSSQRQLARRFGVSRSAIQWIHNGRNWPSEWPADLRVQEWPDAG